MKVVKLSKTSWLILITGVFVVALAALGLTRFQQVKEQNAVIDELAMYEKRLAASQTTQLSQNLEDVRIKLEESQSQLSEARERLRQTVVSVDVTEEFFKIAEYCNVKVENLSTSPIADVEFEGINCSSTSLSASVSGETIDIVDFIISLNNGYTTGNVRTAQINNNYDSDADGEGDGEGEGEGEDEGGDTEADKSTASVNMIIYSYEGM